MKHGLSLLNNMCFVTLNIINTNTVLFLCFCLVCLLIQVTFSFKEIQTLYKKWLLTTCNKHEEYVLYYLCINILLMTLCLLTNLFYFYSYTINPFSQMSSLWLITSTLCFNIYLFITVLSLVYIVLRFGFKKIKSSINAIKHK